ncbi:MAG TPA: MdtA/MuxA family multidrug efflux RND transporter periplasmic adaptor subunit [Steroidobacteraceae bacterium]|nr:MdtA/MuxA family multidrug efflux RND transporter periplasmic adaptor subunit [Steroidobacteraceae bacterium]
MSTKQDEVAEAGARRGFPWRWFWIGIGVALVALLVWRIHASATATPTRTGGRFGQNGVLTVGVAKVTTGDIALTLNALGTVTPLATVTVRAQVSGTLDKVTFTEGQMVKAGQVLALVDPRSYQAVLDQAKGTLARDQAQLANARIDLTRYLGLLTDNLVSHQQYDTQAALVKSDEAAIVTDQAAVEAAQLNLDYCRITSPLSGRVGLRQVDPGNLIQASAATGIAVVTQLQPISVLFTVPEDSLAQLMERLKSGAKLSVDAYDRAQTRKLASGTLATADNEIDTTTGTLKLRALFDNADTSLFPNQFVNVRLLLDTLHDQTVIPGAALQNGASGTFVYLVNGDSTVSMRQVVTGNTDGDRVAITMGLMPGDTVVVDGADQLRDGARIALAGAAGAPSGAGQGQRRRRQGGAQGGNGSSSGGGERGAGRRNRNGGGNQDAQ